ncbi:carboxylesterase [Microbacterium sp. Root61]|uniref:carboxylesterase/lipase family protein n=1 Tax=Microbacterium sp. Root61 TaxID=1736570 RepID=UPI0006FB83B3|nr:carboxylesterase family protein [Microbacterium sp. Root61]KRA25241.1 carboxylesterase [Microbacterium sp. Root61]
MTTLTPPEVQTTAGIVRGFWREPTDATGSPSAAFLGIPFAEPPVGDLRFAAPVPHGPWEGVRDAVEFGATPHRAVVGEMTLIPEPAFPGESTLNVNVFTPAPVTAGADAAASAGLPVLVYIHGGGYVSGSPSSPWYDGAAFNRDGVIVVSVSYRLGFDGFGFIEDAPMNRGVLDWLLALEWVQQNIAAFGGDPRRVALSGQSAGGGAVLTLLGIPRAQHLFRGVWSISGVPTAVTLEAAEAAGRALAERGGVAPTLAGLRSLPEARILELQAEASPMNMAGDPSDPVAGLVSLVSGGLVLGPVVDGDLIPLPSREAYAAGIGADKALVLGATDQEFNMVLAGAKESLAEVPPAALLGRLATSPEVVDSYLAAHEGFDTADAVGQYLTDHMFRAPAVDVAEARARFAVEDPSAARTWLYRFAWASPTMGSACHCLDVPFFFDTLDAERVEGVTGPTPSQVLADDVHGGVLALVRDAAADWPAWNNTDREARVFDDPASSVQSDAFADVRMLLTTGVSVS